MKVSFIDLQAQYQAMQQEIDEAMAHTITHSAFIKSAAVKDFEAQFASYLGAGHVISCGNGTDSMEILLRVMDVGPGDEVIVPAMSWISTSEVVATAGATPVFVDIDPQTYTLDVTLAEAHITRKTKAIIPVHLYGHPADMSSIMALAEKHTLNVIEDCAQAHGAGIQGRKIGTWGHAASFSFFPTKNLGAFGDAGAMIVQNDAWAQEARMIAHHGQESRHQHRVHGRNSRMDGLQAAILSAKLPYLDQWVGLRIRKAALYDALLADVPQITIPIVKPDCRHAYHLYVVRAENRDMLKQYLADRDIDSLIHYPVASPFQPCYASMHHKDEDFPIASRYQQEILSLPIYPELPEEAIRHVVQTIKTFYAR